MTEREYKAICNNGHRTYLRLRVTEPPEFGTCKSCNEPALLRALPSVQVAHDPSSDDGGYGEGSYFQHAMGKDG